MRLLLRQPRLPRPSRPAGVQPVLPVLRDRPWLRLAGDRPRCGHPLGRRRLPQRRRGVRDPAHQRRPGSRRPGDPEPDPLTYPDRFEPITDALVGGHLTNTYRLQGPALGLPPATGLYFVGDAVMTTNPAACRNLALLLPHVQHFLASLDDPQQDLHDASLALDAWSEQHLRPWYLDHAHWDRTLLRRFAGEDLDLTDRIPSDVICAAIEVDDSLKPYVGMYSGMVAGPEILEPVEELSATCSRRAGGRSTTGLLVPSWPRRCAHEHYRIRRHELEDHPSLAMLGRHGCSGVGPGIAVVDEVRMRRVVDDRAARDCAATEPVIAGDEVVLRIALDPKSMLQPPPAA